MQDMIGMGISGAKWFSLIVALMAYIFYVRMITLPAPFNMGNIVVNLVLPLITGGLYIVLTHVMVNSLYTAILTVLGIAVGLLVGRAAKISSSGSQVIVKRSLTGPVILMVAYILSLFFISFGTKVLMSAGMLLVVAATALLVTAEITGAIKAQRYTANAK